MGGPDNFVVWVAKQQEVSGDDLNGRLVSPWAAFDRSLLQATPAQVGKQPEPPRGVALFPECSFEKQLRRTLARFYALDASCWLFSVDCLGSSSVLLGITSSFFSFSIPHWSFK